MRWGMCQVYLRRMRIDTASFGVAPQGWLWAEKMRMRQTERTTSDSCVNGWRAAHTRGSVSAKSQHPAYEKVNHRSACDAVCELILKGRTMKCWKFETWEKCPGSIVQNPATQLGFETSHIASYVPNHGDLFCHLINQISCLILAVKDSLKS